MPIHALHNPVLHHAWGSRTFLPELLGAPSPAEEPWAELWLGAHPRGPSRLALPGEPTLAAWIAADPAGRLGAEATARFGPALPFLLKILAVAEPLSLQLHPDAERAAAGFAEEEARGLPGDDPERRYPDPHAKPELVCALTPFEALCGLREPQEVRDALARVGAKRLLELLEPALDAGSPTAAALGLLLRAPKPPREAALEELVARLDPATPQGRWTRRLHALHPGDPGVAAPWLLGYVRLAPGEALFLEPGVLHSYLEGVAIELQASSDNVLRGGITRRHVDVDALLASLREPSVGPRRVAPREDAPHTEGYEPPSPSFRLSRIHVPARTPVSHRCEAGLELLLCLEGEPRLVEAGRDDPVALAPGRGAVVAASTPGYAVLPGDAPATLFRASLGRAH